MGIDLFGHDHLCLTLLLMEDSVIQKSTLVEKLDVTLGVLANGDSSMAQSIGGPSGLDLVDHFIILKREVLGKNAGLLERENDVELVV